MIITWRYNYDHHGVQSDGSFNITCFDGSNENTNKHQVSSLKRLKKSCHRTSEVEGKKNSLSQNIARFREKEIYDTLSVNLFLWFQVKKTRRPQESIGPQEFFVTNFQIAVLSHCRDINETRTFHVSRRECRRTALEKPAKQ